MDELDTKIARALSNSHSDISISDDTSMIGDLTGTFDGKYQAFFVLASIKTVAMVTLMFFSIYQFFQQDALMPLIAYASLVVICAITISVIFTFFWITINKNHTLKEIKRLELQIALLVKKVD